MSRISLVLILPVLLLLPLLAAADTGVRGRVAWRGELVEGVRVKAFREVAAIAAGEAVAVSAPTGLDGIYQLELEPGSYVLTASNADGVPRAGDLFCYYSGSPVRVTAGDYRNVGFNLIRIPAEAPPQEAERSGIFGELSFQGEPLEQAYLYVYRDPTKGFKGPGYFIQPVARGSFRLNLPPGEYYLLARKRARGGQFGPIEIGDQFNYYHGNPLRIGPGELHEVRIETITRLSMLEQDVVADFRGVRGKVLDQRQRPREGLYVFAYRDPAMTGTPDHFSAPTDADGRFELALPEDGPFFLLARENFGGPAEAGEDYGKLTGEQGGILPVEAGEESVEVTIHVEPNSAL